MVVPVSFVVVFSLSVLAWEFGVTCPTRVLFPICVEFPLTNLMLLARESIRNFGKSTAVCTSHFRLFGDGVKTGSNSAMCPGCSIAHWVHSLVQIVPCFSLRLFLGPCVFGRF